MRSWFSELNVAESLFIEIVKPQGKNIVTGVIYRPPNQNVDEFLTMTNELLSKISKENKICYLMGDFNLNLMNHQSHSATGEFLDALYSNMFFPLITRPTRLTSHSATLIDNIFVNQFFEWVTPNELAEISNAFRSGKSAGHDGIPISIIKQSIQIIAEPLAHIINLSITRGIVPDQMKIACVVPLFKAGDRSLCTNYRPVSILPSFSKFLEKVVYSRLYNYLCKLEILCDNQFGFRKNHSTLLALIDLYEKISLALDRNEHAVGVFLDLSKAFDTVDHNILLDKLEHYGIWGVALDWVRSYLSNRLQFVQFNGHSSSPQTICCGVPQGSILGPLFFLLYINDLSNVSTVVELILFADDTNLFMSHKDPVYLATSLNSELNKLSAWFKANKHAKKKKKHCQ